MNDELTPKEKERVDDIISCEQMLLKNVMNNPLFQLYDLADIALAFLNVSSLLATKCGWKQSDFIRSAEASYTLSQQRLEHIFTRINDET